jgi:hypothetical protein
VTVRLPLALVALVALVALGGCGEADHSDPPGLGPAPLHPVPGCERIDHRGCDVTQPACQARLTTLAACVRGNGGDEPAEPPPISTMTEAEYAKYLTELLAGDPPPSPNHYEATLVMLGLTAPGSFAEQAVVAEQVKWIGGFYRGDTKDIVLVEHAEKRDATENSILLVHELIHALQDRDVGLDAFRDEHATSTDSLTAVRALIEGEATLHEARYAAAVLGLDPASVDWRKHFTERIERSLDSLAEETSAYGPAYTAFAYTFGARYAHLAFEDGGLAGVLARYGSPAVTTQAIFASADRALSDEPAPAAIPAPSPSPEWTPFTETTLGALGVYIACERHLGVRATALSIAAAWRNDRLFVYSSSAASTSPDTAFAWHLDFAAEADASVFAEGLSDAVLTVQRAGAHVTVAQAASGAALPWAFAR